jgi:hypothetical protein
MTSTTVDTPHAGREATNVVELHLTSVPARDLPVALVHDVAKVLRAHGLDPELLDLSSALYRVIEATPAEKGGSR